MADDNPLESTPQKGEEITELVPLQSNTAEQEPTKEPRTYEQMKAELKLGAIAMSPEEGKIYFGAQKAENDAKKQKEKEASDRFWKYLGTPLVRILCYGIYFVWSITPIIGIVIGFIYIKNEDCPGETSIAPLLVTLGFMSLLVGIGVGTKKGRDLNQGQKGVDPEGDADGTANGTDGSASGTVNEPQTKVSGIIACLALCSGCLVSLIIVLKVVHLILWIVTIVKVYNFSGHVKFDKNDLNLEDIEAHYCNQVLFTFAFWSVTIPLIILGLVIFFSCCIFCSYCAYTEHAVRKGSN